MSEDIFDTGPEQGNESSMKRLIAMAREVIDTENLVNDLEENLSELKKRLNRMKTIELPDMMAECGMSEFKTDSGFNIKIEDFVSGSLPKDDEKRRAAIHWLEANGGESLIKSELSMTFEKSQHNEAVSLMVSLQEQGYEVSSKMGVHPQTLLAHIRERMKNGDEVPLETLGLFAGRVAKIKPPKK